MVTDNVEDNSCKQPPEKKAKTADAAAATTLPPLKNIQEAADFVEKLNGQQLNMLFAAIIDRQQKETGAVNEVLSYQNVKNSRKMQYLRVPTNKTEESFMKNSAWINRAIEINGGGKDEESKNKTVKLILKKIKKTYRQNSISIHQRRWMQ
jgi:hypothetical protein